MSDDKSFLTPDFSPNDAVGTFGMAKYLLLSAGDFPYMDFTISFWMQSNASGTILFYGDKESSSTFDTKVTTMEVRLNGSIIEADFKTASTNPGTVSAALSGNGAHYVAITYKQDPDTSGTATVQIFIDDASPVIQQVQLINSENNKITLPETSSLYIGTQSPDEENHIQFSDIFTGTITDLRIWSHAMSSGEILDDSFKEVYGEENGLYAALPLNTDNIDLKNNIAIDLTDRHNAKCLQVFDNPGFIYLNSINFPTGDRTIEMWLRCGNDANGYLMNYGDYSNSDNPNEGTNPWALTYFGSLSINGRNTGVAFNDGEWHHIAVVVDVISETVFLDGTQTYQASRTDAPLIPNQVFLLGAKNADATDQVFNGQIQRVYFWNKALNADDVLERALSLPLSDDQKASVNAVLPLTSNTGMTDGPVPAYSTSGGFRLMKDISPLSDDVNWERDQKITSRVSLTDDPSIQNGQLIPNPVYRISLTVSPRVKSVKIWIPENITASVDDVPIQFTPDVPYVATPSIFSKVQISIPATDIRCPMLKIQTDQMEADQFHYLFPDIEAHKKLVDLKMGQLATSDTRTALAINPVLTDDDLGQFQTTVQNIARTVQHTYNRTPHSLHRDRKVLPINMANTHFKVEFNGAKPAYTKLQPSQVPDEIRDAVLKNGNGQEGFFDIAKNYLVNATKIIVHTIEEVGEAIVQTVDNVGSDLVKTVDVVGEDLVHGDIRYAGQNLLQGGENIGKDLFRGAGGVIGSPVAGTGQLLVITLHTDTEIVKYVLSHTGDVGRVLSALFQKIGVELTKLVNWLLDKLPWADIINTQTFLYNRITTGIDKVTAMFTTLKTSGDAAFSNFANAFQGDIDSLMSKLSPFTPGQIQQQDPGTFHSGAVEQVEWLLGKMARNGAASNALTMPVMNDDQNNIADQFFGLIESSFGEDGRKLVDKLQTSSVRDLNSVFTSTTHSVEYIISAFLELVKVAFTMCIEALKIIFDFMIQMMESVLAAIKTLLTQDWHIPFITDLYAAVTNGAPLKILGFACLLVAIPTTIISIKDTGVAPYKPAAPITERLAATQARNIIDYSYTYGACHVILAPVSMAIDIKGLVATKASSAATIIKEILGGKAPETPTAFDVFDWIFVSLNCSFGLISQFMVNPYASYDTYVLPGTADKDDVLKAPNYWSNVIWIYQWFGWGPHYITTSVVLYSFRLPERIDKIGTFLSIYDTAFGIAHMALMAKLDNADRNKISALVEDRANMSAWTSDDLNYYNWGTNNGAYVSSSGELNIASDSPLYRKTFSNIMDTAPEIGQLGALPVIVEATTGYSFTGTLLADTLGHLGEGITIIIRTENNEIY